MEVYEVTTKNGRIFRVAIENKNQKARFDKILEENKKKSYEVFVEVECVSNGIQSIKEFESLSKSLV